MPPPLFHLCHVLLPLLFLYLASPGLGLPGRIPTPLDKANNTTTRRLIPPRTCGTGPPTDDLREAHRVLHSAPRIHPRQAINPHGITIQTYFHFVTTFDQAPSLSDSVRAAYIDSQTAVLNKSYAPANISFVPAAPATYTISDAWANDSASSLMKRSLRRGPYSALNLYFQTALTVSSLSPSTPASTLLLGYCTLPTTGVSAASAPATYALDGCDILAGSMPGGGVEGYEMGKTAVHEVGHWMGLLHTFQDETCAVGDAGDFVEDTKQEAVSTEGCPVGKDSCPGVGGGGDPIHNFMDYSVDECYTSFTPGQNARMVGMFNLLRQGK